MAKPRPPFAQHFLEPAWVRKLVEAIGPRGEDAFLEIGPGRGALTLAMAATGARVVAIEIDRGLSEYLVGRVPDHVTVIIGDILTVDLAALLASRLLGTTAHGRVKRPISRVVGNLPYNICSPVLFKLLALQRTQPAFSDATLMLQREVANRVVAEPGTRDYGPVAILTQIQADATKLMTLPPGAFRPIPRVHSAVVRLTFREPEVAVPDPTQFEQMVRSLFQRRRKMLLNALGPFAESCGISAASAIRSAGLDPRCRPDTLQLAEMVELAGVLKAC